MVERTDVRICLGRRVRSLRALRGWTQDDLAIRAGMQRSYVGAVERGERNLSLENLDRLATAFEVTLAHLLHFDRLDGAVEPALLD